MVNFRFHLVSLTAVFFALAAGITIGAGVVDRATVDQIENQLRVVAERREETNAENDRLRTDLDRWTEFGDQAASQAVRGHLEGTSVFLVAVAGVDRTTVERSRDLLTSAGAAFDGTLWFTGKWRLASADDQRRLAGVLDVAPTLGAAELRAAGLAAVGTGWATGGSAELVATLLAAGFLEFEAPPLATLPVSELPRSGSLFVVVSSDGADVPSADLAEPLVARLSGSQVPVLAAQPQRPPPRPDLEDIADLPEEFVFSLRADPAVAGRISTVDNIDDFRGRFAAVMALRQLQTGRTGHYGFGRDARIVPEPTP